MQRLTLHPEAKARQHLARLEEIEKLSQSDAVIISNALKNCPVPDAANRLSAGWARILLRSVMQ